MSLWLLRRPSVKRNTLLFRVVFWFNFMNVGNLFDYVPIRTFVLKIESAGSDGISVQVP